MIKPFNLLWPLVTRHPSLCFSLLLGIISTGCSSIGPGDRAARPF